MICNHPGASRPLTVGLLPFLQPLPSCLCSSSFWVKQVHRQPQKQGSERLGWGQWLDFWISPFHDAWEQCWLHPFQEGSLSRWNFDPVSGVNCSTLLQSSKKRTKGAGWLADSMYNGYSPNSQVDIAISRLLRELGLMKQKWVSSDLLIINTLALTLSLLLYCWISPSFESENNGWEGRGHITKERWISTSLLPTLRTCPYCISTHHIRDSSTLCLLDFKVLKRKIKWLINTFLISKCLLSQGEEVP